MSAPHLPTSASIMMLLACLCLAGVGLGAFLLLQVRSRRATLDRRFAAALDAHERLRVIDLTPSVGLALPGDAPSRLARLQRLFGTDPERLDLYPAAPPVLLVGTLAAAIVAGYVLGLIIGRLAFLLVPVLWLLASRTLFGRYHRRRAELLFRQFPDALAMIVRAVRVGIPVTESIRAVARENEAPTAGEFARLADQLAIGVALDEALRSMARRNGLAEYRFFATALSLQGQTGGNLSETLENLADVIRKRVAARARGFALAAEARMSANVLTVLPVLLFVVLWFMNPGYIAEMLGSTAGHIILGTTLLLLGGGTGAMRLMIKASLS